MVVVVGASISGLQVALDLARRGTRVRVLERGGGPSVRRRLIVTQALPDLVPFIPGMVLSEVRVYEFIAPGGRAVVSLKRPDLVIERRDLIGSLLKEAVSAGVKVEEGWTFRGLQGDQALFAGPRGDEALPFQWLVGADGARSSVAEALGTRLEVVHLLQARVELPPDHPPGLSRIWLEPDLTPYFLWLFPDSPKTGVLGVIAPKEEGVRRALREALSEGGYQPLGYEGGVVTLFDPSFPPQRGRVLLVGDAAGQVKVSTVGGTVTGLRGAKACARAILHGRDYMGELRGLYRELLLHRWVRVVLNRMGSSHYGKLLKLAARNDFLGSLCRDELLKAVTALPFRAPFFTLRGLFLMLRVLAGR